MALVASLALSSITAVIAGTDEGAIIDVVTQRSNAQRQQILKAYKAHYGRVLLLPLPPCSVLLPVSCPFPHRDLPLAERNPAPGAVGSQGTPICSDMTPPKEDQVVNQPPVVGCTTSPRGGHPFPFTCPILGATQRTPESECP